MTLYENLCASSLDITTLGFVPDGKLGTSADGEVLFTQSDKIYANGIPVAKDFSDFLGLLCCVDASFLPQMSRWTQLRFGWELEHHSTSKKQQMVRNALRNYFHVPQIRDPYAYIQSLQATPEQSKSPLGTSVSFGNTVWYTTAEKIRTDKPEILLCGRISGQDVLSYYRRWEHIAPDEEQRLLMEASDPFALHFDITATVNGTMLSPKILESTRWDPLADNTHEAAALMQRLGLDREQGWVFLRLHIPYHPKKQKRVRSLSLQLEPKTITVPGPRVTTPTVSPTISICHPITAEHFDLTIHSCTQEGLDPNFLTNPPCFYTRICYYLTPALGEDVFQIIDSVSNDPLRPAPGTTTPHPDPALENAPTAELVEIDEDLPTHIRTAFSARHYKEISKTNWLTRFHFRAAPAAVLTIV